MTVTDQEFAALSRRVAALEASDSANTKSIEFIASTLGGMKTVQDNHTKRLDGIDLRLDRIEADVRVLKVDVKGLRDDMPGIVAEALREVLAARR